MTTQELEAREADVQVAQETANAAAFAVRAATSELRRTEARLAPSTLAAPGRVMSVTAPIEGVVLRRLRESETVVPAGFMKISALGVEEQRVNVVLDFVEPSAAARAALGDGYRVEVRVVVWESPDVVKVPTSALFRHAERWAVYVIDRGRARRTLVELGRQTGQHAEVRAGLAEHSRVILHPGDTLVDGARVRERASAD